MGCKKNGTRFSLKKKLSTFYAAFLIIATAFLSITPPISAETNAILTTYDIDDLNTETTEFGNGSFVIVEVNLSNHDANTPIDLENFTMEVTNQTGEQAIWFRVFDNESGPWGNNTDGDYIFWGGFIVGSNSTDNSSTPGEPNYLHMYHLEQANISELPGIFENHSVMNYQLITANYSQENQPQQNSTLLGWIKDNETDQPLDFVTVILNRTDIPAQPAIVQTNATGIYLFNNNVSAGTYDIIVYEEGSFMKTYTDLNIEGNSTIWYNITVDLNSSGEHGDDPLPFVQGYVKDTSGTPLADASVELMRMDGWYENNTYMTNQTGYFSFDLSVDGAGPGHYELMVFLDDYAPYCNWSVEIEPDSTHWINVSLPELFETPSYIQGRVLSQETSEVIEDAELMILNSDFNYMMAMEEMNEDNIEDYSNNYTINEEEGWYRIPILFEGTYNIVAFGEGYYAAMTPTPITITAENTTSTYNFSLVDAEPDEQTITITFTDLDDITVTVNRSIIAESPVVRFAIDFMPEYGNSDGTISSEEVEDLIQEMRIDGPTVGLELDELEEEGEGKEDKGPDFLTILLNLYLDQNQVDNYLPGTFNATLDNLANTTVESNETIYYNATFGLTLDGEVLNQLLHNLTLACEYAVIINNTINLDTATYYTINETNSNENVTLTADETTLTMHPGEGILDEIAYGWITLELNTSTVPLPIIETPTLHVTDEWIFNQTTPAGSSEILYRVNGKPLQEWDTHEFSIEDENASYLCYTMAYENISMEHQDFRNKFSTIDNLDWVKLDENHTITAVVDDISFPAYADKTWETTAWWDEEVTATIVSIDETKITPVETFESVILINYTNATDALVGQEWYSPTINFFINRTRLDDGAITHYLELTEYTLAPFIESVDDIYENDSNDDSLIDTLELNITINTSFMSGSQQYVLEGPLYKENRSHGPPEDITYIWEEFTLDNSTSETVITVTYSGSIIRGKEVNGPYTGYLELRLNGEWGPSETLDSIDIETDEYNYTSFAQPAVAFENITSFGNDTNDNGRYDYLTLNITLNVSQPGNYYIQGGIDYVIQHTYWDEWWWITGAGTPPIYLENGTTTVQLNFDGREFFDRGYDGTYHYHIEIQEDTTWDCINEKDGNLQTEYNASDFETPTIFFNSTYMSQSGQHDYINNSNYLSINTSIFIGEGTLGGGTGTYDVHGGLHFYNTSSNDWGDYVTGFGREYVLSEGDNIITVNLDIGEIYNRVQEEDYNGSFILGMGFSERIGDWWGSDIDNYDYITSNYSIDNFPEPAVSMTIIDSSITNGGDTLAVQAYINITSDIYANNTYDVHGGVHYIQGGENGWWEWITGNGQQIYLEYGSNLVTLNFSGMEIASFGQPGPYAIWMGAENTDTWEQLCNDEYTTEAYTLDQFSTPSVTIDDSSIVAAINGTDYLTISLPINVTESGTYHIGGGIHWIEHMDGWDNWMFITGTGREYELSVGEQTIDVNFEQSMIKEELNRTHYDGPLTAYLSIDAIIDYNWQFITQTEFETQSFSEDDFAAGAVTILDTACTIDEDGNLVVNMSIESQTNDTYRIHGGLHYIEDMGDWDNWWWITGYYQEDYALTNATEYLEMTFNGGEIYNSMQNGPYMIWIGIENQTTYRIITEEEIQTGAYSYMQFSAAAPSARIKKENMTTGTCDYLNGSFFTVNVTFEKTNAGTQTYWLDGGVEYVNENQNIWEWITGNGQEITLSEGNNTLAINFNAGDIYTSGRDGPYRVYLNLRNDSSWIDIDHYEYTTQSYSADSAPPPPVSFIEPNSTDTYVNGSYFTINITINVSSSGYEGEYDLHGGIHYQHDDGWWEHITGMGQWIELEEGYNNLTLNYNAGEINRRLPADYDGPLSIFLGLNPLDEPMEIARLDYETQSYTKDDFPGPALELAITGAYVNDSYFTVNATITVESGNDGEYDIHGGVNWIDDSRGWDEWRYITGNGQSIDLSEGTNNVAFNFNAGEIYQTLTNEGVSARLSIYMGINSMEDWMEITNDEYWTPEEYSSSDFNPPELTLEYLSDYVNNSGDYLTVNVSINATGSSLNQLYDVHAGIHYTSGWEWRYITGTGRQINVTENMTVPINFNGGAIRSCEEDGPYEVWVGISAIDNWEDITHTESQTGAYLYTDFAAPAVRIISDSLSDYANGTYLTINVTVNATETGDYLLEGGLHWREGYRWEWITWAGEDITISSTGEQTYALDFESQELKRAAEEGWTGQDLVAWINIMNSSTWTEIHHIDEYELGEYSPDDFSTLPIQFNGDVTDAPYNSSGGSAPYDFLNVTVPINITLVGDYEILAGIFDKNNDTLLAKTNASITTDQETITVSFNGTKINKKHHNGTYEFRAKIVNDTTKKEYDRTTQDLEYYSYTQFTTAVPEATFEDTNSSYILAGDLIVNLTINVSQIGHQLEVYAELFDSEGEYIAFANAIDWYNTTGAHPVQLTFDGEKINTSGLDGPYILEYARLSIIRNNDIEEIESCIDIHETASYTYDQFGGVLL